MDLAILAARRLTGAHAAGDWPGVAIALRGDDRVALGLLREELREVLDAVGWRDAVPRLRAWDDGAELTFPAPADALHSACAVGELACLRANARREGREPHGLDAAAAALRAWITAEREPRFTALREAAARRGVGFLADDELVTVGMGLGSRTFARTDLPDAAAVDWTGVHDIPVALVTGTNGKTTTVRLTAAIAAASGKTVGCSTTDGVRIGREMVATGDYSGPEGARLALRDRRTEVAVLELARGGLLRRGLAVGRASAAAVLNVGRDHLGEGGIRDLDALARLKLLVSRAVPDRGLCLNAADPTLARIASDGGLDRGIDPDPGRRLPACRWFAADPDLPRLRAARAAGSPTATVRDHAVVLGAAGAEDRVAELARIPITLGGRADHNVENVLAAALLAHRLGCGIEAIAAGLRSFAGNPIDNPGRGNLFAFGSVLAYADFAHNPEAVAALARLADRLAPSRRLIVLGQAGDRDDAALRALCEATVAARAQRILIKPLHRYLRGRPEGELIERLVTYLREAGAADDAVTVCESELHAVREALAWARPGDLLLLLLHEARAEALELLTRLHAAGWRPGQPV